MSNYSNYVDNFCPVCGANKFNPDDVEDWDVLKCPRCGDMFTGYPDGDGDKIRLICNDCGLKFGYIYLVKETKA